MKINYLDFLVDLAIFASMCISFPIFQVHATQYE